MAVGALALAGPAVAHRGHASLSVVEIDGLTGAVTVTHLLTAHDVEPALRLIAPRAQPSVDDDEAMAAFVAYAGRAFRLAGPDGRPVALKHVRTDQAGDSDTLVYSARLAARAKTVVVDSRLLEETYPDQENQVNVRRSKVTRTAVFRSGEGAQRIAFD
jgi:hypothetical protein